MKIFTQKTSNEKMIYNLLLLAFTILFLISSVYTQFNPLQVIQEQNALWTFLLDDFLPPNFQFSSVVFASFVITLCMAISSVFVAGILAFVFSMFGSEYISPLPVLAKVIRAMATFSRNIPILVWAFILFSSLGVGTGVGFIALVITSFAFMTRAFIEVIDEISQDSVDSLVAVGATFWQRIFQGIIPCCMPGFISWFLYCLEVNIRASTIVGMVGGGGIGLILLSYLKSFKYSTAAGIIILIAIMVILVDMITGFLRRKVMD